jgi:hypothetical protein
MPDRKIPEYWQRDLEYASLSDADLSERILRLEGALHSEEDTLELVRPAIRRLYTAALVEDAIRRHVDGEVR